jgi:hypothetical protein
MLEALIQNLPWVVGWLGLFSFLSVQAWTSQRRQEREAFYKSEAIKKIAEMQGNTPEAVLQLLRESLASWNDRVAPGLAHLGPIQAREYFRSQTLQKIVDAPGAGAEAALTFLREERRNSARRGREGAKLGGTITVIVGIGLTLILWVLVKDQPVYLTGLIPVAVGVVLLAYGFVFAPKDQKDS